MVALTIKASNFEFDGGKFNKAFNEAAIKLFKGAARAFYERAIAKIPIRTGFVFGAFGVLKDLVGAGEATPSLYKSLHKEFRLKQKVERLTKLEKRIKTARRVEKILYRLKKSKNQKGLIEKLKEKHPRFFKYLKREVKERRKKEKGKGKGEAISNEAGREAFVEETRKEEEEAPKKKGYNIFYSSGTSFKKKLAENYKKYEEGGTIENLKTYAKSENKAERIDALKRAHQERLAGREVTTKIPARKETHIITTPDTVIGERGPREVGLKELRRDIDTHVDVIYSLNTQQLHAVRARARANTERLTILKDRAKEGLGKLLGARRKIALEEGIEEPKSFKAGKRKTIKEFRREYLEDKRREILGIDEESSLNEQHAKRRRARASLRRQREHQQGNAALKGAGKIEFYYDQVGDKTSLTLKTPSSGRNFAKAVLPTKPNQNGEYIFTFGIDISYFGYNDEYENEYTPSAPWKAMETGRFAFDQYIRDNASKLPNVNSFLQEVVYELTKDGQITRTVNSKPVIAL